jgi:hypothetical protein
MVMKMDIENEIKEIEKKIEAVLKEIDEPKTDSIDEKKNWAGKTRPITIFIGDTKDTPLGTLIGVLDDASKRAGEIKERAELWGKA